MAVNPGYQPNPLRPLALVIGLTGVLALAVLGVGLLAAGPFVPPAAHPAPVAVRTYLPGTQSLAGPPSHSFDYQGGIPAAVLDLRGVPFGGTVFRAAWYDNSGRGEAYVQGRDRDRFQRPIPVTVHAIAAAGTQTFVFGAWDPHAHRYRTIYARTDIEVVVRR